MRPLPRVVPAGLEDGWRVCDAPTGCGDSAVVRVRVFDRTRQQVLFNYYACSTHEKAVTLMARKRDD